MLVNQPTATPASCRDHNIRALALHLLSDALGSIAVIVTSLTIWLSDAAWANYLDPICSLLICAITFAVTLPLLKSAAVILMQVRVCTCWLPSVVHSPGV